MLRALELPEDDRVALDNIEHNMMESDPLLARDNPGLAFFMRKIIALDTGDSEDVFNKDVLLRIARSLKQIQVSLSRIDELYSAHVGKRSDKADFMFMFPAKENMMGYWKEMVEAKKIDDEHESFQKRGEAISKMIDAIEKAQDDADRS